MSPALSSTKVCYNSECMELKSARKVCRLRNGEYVEFCDRCASVYEEGRFCETFHLSSTGWRCCETCGKQVHCGCIVSSHAFTLLDPGGIECMTCARKNVPWSNPAWPTSLCFHPPLQERLKDLSVKNWNQLAGSGPVPWRQAPSLFNSSIPASEQSRFPYEVDISGGINKLNANDRLSASPLEKKKIEDLSERLMNGNLKLGSREIFDNGNAGIKSEENHSSCLSQQSSSLKEDPSTPQFGLTAPHASPNETNAQIGVSRTHLRTTPTPLPKQFHGATRKMKATKRDPDNVEALEGLDTLANLAILGEGETLPASSQATTKHPRHRPGCSCIVCIQPPSGKGPKHKQSCTCNVCQTVKRRFRTLMMRREKKQSEKEAETIRKKQHQQQPRQLPVPEKLQDDDSLLYNNTGNSSPKQIREINEVSDDEPNKMKSSSSPFKGQIDLNIQPEREEELSPGSDSGSMMKLLQDATERYLKQQRLSSSGGNSSANQSHPSGDVAGGEKLTNIINLGSNHSDADEDRPVSLSIKASASTPAAG
ncbi:b3 domain-containing transcription factor val3 [Quercus suber]|uniref:B3 domain-containing transcription factor val3 n=1 Tax=Quercus suber TaxID=58331 RepID=A0AAW0IFS8_QUESU